MKKILFITFLLILILAIPATVYLVSQQQELRKKAAPATAISLSPATVTADVGGTFTLEITLDTGENQVVAAEIHLIFDPDKLEAQTITNSTLFPSILTSGVVDRGTASITVGAANVQTPVNGHGTVAVVRFKALSATGSTPAKVSFAQNTFIGGLGEGSTNVLVGTTPANITITGTAALTPTLAPTLSPTIAPTVTTTLTPTTTLTATPSVTPVLTLTPTSTLSAQASASAVQILTPAGNTSVTTTQPTLTGKAPPGSTVTLTIYSTPQTVVVRADSNGNWTYTPTTPLDNGPHNVVASATDTNGSTATSTTSFVVAQGATGAASQSAIPISGNVSWTVILISLGLLLFVIGLISPILI